MNILDNRMIGLVPRGWLPNHNITASSPPQCLYISKNDWVTAGCPNDIESYHEWILKNSVKPCVCSNREFNFK